MVRADLRRHLFSSLGILLLVSVAFSGTVAVSLFERGLRTAGVDVARDSDLVIGAAGSEIQLVLGSIYLQTNQVLPLTSYSLVEKLTTDKRVALLSPLVFADHYEDFPIVGIGVDYPALRPNIRLAQGRWPVKDFELAVGATSNLKLGQVIESSHGISRQDGVEEAGHHEASYTVVGRLALTQTPADRCLYTPFMSLWEIHEEAGQNLSTPEIGTKTISDIRQVSAILVKPRDFASAYSLRAEFRSGITTAAFPGEVLASLFAVFEDIRTAFTYLSVAFQVIVLAAVILSLLASLPSRSRWIGLLRSLGAGKLYVFLTLWIPSALIFLFAGVMGSCVGWLAATGIGGMVENRTGLHLGLDWTATETSAILIFWMVGLSGSLLPAWKGFQTSVRTALLARN